MTQVYLGLLALAFEWAALFVLVYFDSNAWQLLRFFLLHAFASASLAAFVRYALPEYFRQPRLPVTMLLFCFSFFMPILGLVGLFACVMVATYLPRMFRKLRFAQVIPVAFQFPRRESRTRFSAGGLTTRLRDRTIPQNLRLRSLLALQGMPARIANPILREMLADPADDIRLVAYGMLDTQEKGINQRIHQEIEKLAAAADDEKRHVCLRHLAELYWELVYGGLVKGDVRQHALHETSRYLESAMQIDPDDPGLWFLKGKMLQAQEQPEAEAAFRRAVACGLEESRVLAYFAEIAYHRRDFAEVRRILGILGEGQSSSRLKPAIRYWAGAESRT